MCQGNSEEWLKYYILSWKVSQALYLNQIALFRLQAVEQQREPEQEHPLHWVSPFLPLCLYISGGGKLGLLMVCINSCLSN